MAEHLTFNGNGIGRVSLTSFFGAKCIIADDEEGMPVEGVFIPLARNGLVKARKGTVNAYFFINKTLIPSADGWTHYFQLKSNPDFAKRMKELGYKMPYLGKMKERNTIKNKKSYEAQLVKKSDYGL